MKVSFTILLLAVASIATAQTTEEEYNYITKGYKIQVESGLDMKKGYALKELFRTSTYSGSITRNMIVKGLYREGKTSPCAAMLIYSNSDRPNDIRYICIPHFLSDDGIWSMYFDSMQNFQASALQSIAFASGKCAAYFAQNN